MFKRGEEAFLVMELRLRDCERRLAMASGRIRVLEGFTDALIANSYEPSVIRTVWSIAMPKITEEQASNFESRNNEYWEGVKEGLQFVSQRMGIEALPKTPDDPLDPATQHALSV